MDDNAIQDLKQFISSEIHEVVVRIDKVEERIDTVVHKVDKLSESVAEAIEDNNEATDSQLKDHEERIGRLEQKAA
jgi:hypothetical protein